MSYPDTARPATDGAGTRRGGRPRDEGREREILQVVGALLAERGFDGVTFEEVARRAGASKSTLYRRWDSRRAMVVAALRTGPAGRDVATVIDTGSLRGDLLALCRRLITTMRSTDGQTAMLLVQAGLDDPELCEEIERSMGPTGARLPAAVLAAAVGRGELPAGVDPFPFEEVAGSTLLLRRLSGLRTDEAYLVALVDSVLVPALRATAQQATEQPAGIFSGRAFPAAPTDPPPPTDQALPADQQGAS